MEVIAFEPSGLEGRLVRVEVDLRRGIPSFDLVGLAACAVREARERVRAALRNSGFEFPLDHVLVSLAPADLPKEGSGYDLPLALAIMGASGTLPEPGRRILAIGELGLDGSVRPVRAVLPAIASALASGTEHFLVPAANLGEAIAIGTGNVYPLSSLRDALLALSQIRTGSSPDSETLRTMAYQFATKQDRSNSTGDYTELRGQPRLRRALEIAAAGGHHLLLVGPPGCGKTMAAQRFTGLLPDLTHSKAVSVASLRSLSGLISPEGPIDSRPPFRMPHHSASPEGILGGGRSLLPGEISLAHHGVLFLDEAGEFRTDVLQALREPIEEGRVTLTRAGKCVRYPAEFQLILAANPCPCGRLGSRSGSCICSSTELQRYRSRLGGPLMDRIDIRVSVEPAPVSELLGQAGESSAAIRDRVLGAIALQEARFMGQGISRNSRMGSSLVDRYCHLGGGAAKSFEVSLERHGLSSRACHSILKTARTIADLGGSADINEAHVVEAIELRRYGEGDLVWV